MLRLKTKRAVRALFRTLCLGMALAGFHTPAVVRADTIDYSKGFSDPTGLAVNQANVGGQSWSVLNNNELVLTTAQYGSNGVGVSERESVFSKTLVNVGRFVTSFDFRVRGTSEWMADGITFCIQNQGLTALGGLGGGLGYAANPAGNFGTHISKSVAIKFDVFKNVGDPSGSSTGLYTNGTIPVGGVDLTPYKINLHSGDRFHVEMTYDGVTLKVLLTDTVTLAYAWQSYTIDIPATVGGLSAYVGFTGATGGNVSDSHILAWQFTTASQKPVLASVTVTPAALCGGLNAQGVVTLQQAVITNTVVSLSSSSPLATVPTTITVPAGQTSVTFPIKTSLTQKIVAVVLTAAIEKATVKTTLKVNPIGIDTVGVKANFIPAGQATTGVVTLQVPAAPGPLTVQLTSANPAVVQVPASVTVAAGQTTVEFRITTGAAAVNTPVLITAKLNISTHTTTLTVRPLRVNSVTATAVIVSGGKALTATVTLEAPATIGGVTVKLSASASCLKVPASVVIPVGKTTVSFPVTTTAVHSPTSVILTASSPINKVYTTVIVSP